MTTTLLKTTVSFLLHCLFHTTNKTQRVIQDLSEATGRCIFNAFLSRNCKSRVNNATGTVGFNRALVYFRYLLAITFLRLPIFLVIRFYKREYSYVSSPTDSPLKHNQRFSACFHDNRSTTSVCFLSDFVPELLPSCSRDFPKFYKLMLMRFWQTTEV